MTTADYIARIDALRAEDSIDSAQGDVWQTLSGPPVRRAPVLVVTKWCSRCDTVLPREAFQRNRARSDGRHGWCSDCTNRARAEIARRAGAA